MTFYVLQGTHTYLVSWKGYDAEHNSWVAEEDAGYVLKRVRIT
jgi:hypothetical protein